MNVAIIGAGVIGAGWVARFLLHGHDVSVFDPGLNEARLASTIAAARRHLTTLYDVPLPTEGRLSIASDLATAVQDAGWVQESTPEVLANKCSLLKQIEALVSSEATIASSTSGFTPSALFAQMQTPQRCLVCHPFNPVYLLPLVEVVPAADADAEVVTQSEQLLTSIAMKPLVLRKEIDAHVADRLLEAVWREALWLVRDGVATTEQIDDAIRFGFGLRWAQMGLFETYRIGGGDAGMSQFLKQFGPALAWPWSRLTDVPDLDDALVEKITAQSDAQADGRSVAALEEERDTNLVAILRALKSTDSAAGAHLRVWEHGRA